MPTFRGFILQPTYRVESSVPVLHLFGRLEDGRSFLVRDRRLVPRFYVEKSDAGRAREKGALRQVATDQVTLLGRPVVRIEVKEPADTPPLRDRLAKAGIPTYEADVRFAMRHLIDRGIRGSLEIHGEGRGIPGVGVVFGDPEVGPADWTPRLSVLSLDIETDPAARRLLVIGLHGCGVSEVLLLTPPGRGCPDGARPFPTEKDLLAGFCSRVRELDPDVLTGWNVVDFDLTVLDRIAGPNGVPLELGREGRVLSGIPGYIMDGYTDMGRSPSRTVHRGPEKIRVAACAVTCRSFTSSASRRRRSQAVLGASGGAGGPSSSRAQNGAQAIPAASGAPPWPGGV